MLIGYLLLTILGLRGTAAMYSFVLSVRAILMQAAHACLGMRRAHHYCQHVILFITRLLLLRARHCGSAWNTRTFQRTSVGVRTAT